jgi:hypothetical protein
MMPEHGKKVTIGLEPALLAKYELGHILKRQHRETRTPKSNSRFSHTRARLKLLQRENPENGVDR